MVDDCFHHQAFPAFALSEIPRGPKVPPRSAPRWPCCHADHSTVFQPWPCDKARGPQVAVFLDGDGAPKITKLTHRKTIGKW